MFTGIVEELGQVVDLQHQGDSAVLGVRGEEVSTDAVHGASIAVNGVCLTVTAVDQDVVVFDVMAETLHRSSLGALAVGHPVNLERAMAATDRFGGHIVQGHVDGAASLVSRTPGDRWEVVRMGLPAGLACYVVEKGSITVDGVSLTVSAVGEDFFEVSLIPTTLALTTLGTKQPGDPVNLEVDVIAKYVDRLLHLPGAAPAEATR
ncbi:riboflavin synthase [Auraticoccus monumenti]|uniref:Riboflavin synthase n=1 Tax=Auraticoccus monumenti TaxID=675864 RepID=A0A1G7A209_9ACTN|nr:riboflavin synthase [Auraticoccus monumenti]SDE08988.1 riboflavin synthase alpha chain [Auraticoccus monumenti]